MSRPHYDSFGNEWPNGEGYENEYCPQCGQPDNCGDCNHKPLTSEDVTALGGTLPLTTYTEAGYDFHLHTNGSFVVTHPEVGVMDSGDATMGEVHAEDAGTYMDAWLEDLRCMMADLDAEFGSATNHKGQP